MTFERVVFTILSTWSKTDVEQAAGRYYGVSDAKRGVLPKIFEVEKHYTGHRSKDGGREDMKAEENSKEITERVKCFGRRKKEMNRDLPRSQRREYTAKKRRIAIGTTIGVVLLVILVGYRILPKSSEIGSSGVFETQTVEKTAKQVVQKLSDGEFDDLQDMAIDSMKSTLTQEVMEQAREQIADGKEWGNFLSIGEVYMAEVKQKGQLFAVTEMSVSYENTAVTYRISFDKDMRLAGLYLR